MNIDEKILMEKLKFMEGANKGALEVADFLKEHSPDLVHEIVAFNMVFSGILFAIGLISAVLVIISMWKSGMEYRKTNDIDAGWYLIVGLIFFASALLFLGYSTKTLIQTIVAPKLFLVEYLIGIFK